MGLEFSAVGNHEFDKGSAELKRLQGGGCKTTDGLPDPNLQGPRLQCARNLRRREVPLVVGERVRDGDQPDPVAPYGIKTFDGVRVAFIGMTLRGTPSIVTPTGVAGLQFKDKAKTVNALIPRLRAQGVEAIVLVHQGGFQTSPNVGDIDGCDGNLRNGDCSDSDIGAIISRPDNGDDVAGDRR